MENHNVNRRPLLLVELGGSPCTAQRVLSRVKQRLPLAKLARVTSRAQHRWQHERLP